MVGGGADRQRVDTVRVPVTVTAVFLPAAITRRPDVDGAQTFAALELGKKERVFINISEERS